MGFQKKQYQQTVVCIFIGLTAVFILWGVHDTNRWQPSLKIVVQTSILDRHYVIKHEGISEKNKRKVYETGARLDTSLSDEGSVPRDKIKDVTQEEIRQLRELIGQKHKDMKTAGVLETMVEQRVCTNHENVLSSCIDPNCTGSLPPITSWENIQSLMKPMTKIGQTKLREVTQAFGVKHSKRKYIIITAASSNHFNESQAAIHSLRSTVLPHIHNYSVFYYDLGLEEDQRQQIREYHFVEVLPFPFGRLPRHVRHLRCYAWKPLIVMAHIEHTEFLLWMDTSINFIRDIRSYFDKASKTGLVINRNNFIMPQNTNLKMFSYFGDEPCQFSSYREVEAGIMVFHNEPFIRRLVVEPWGACALDPHCMCPKESRWMFGCPRAVRKYGKCHRYEQSTLGYIAIKVYRDNRPSIFIKDVCYLVRRGGKVRKLELHKLRETKDLKIGT